jgi:hypothetical protein
MSGGNSRDRRKQTRSKERNPPNVASNSTASQNLAAVNSQSSQPLTPPLSLGDWLSIGALLIGAAEFFSKPAPKSILILTLWLSTFFALGAYLVRRIRIGRLRLLVRTVIALVLVGIGWNAYSRDRELTIDDLPGIYRDALQCDFAVSQDAHFPPGTQIAGLGWRDGSVLATLKLSAPPSINLEDVELKLAFDAAMIGAAPMNKNTNATLTPNERNSVRAWEGGSLDKNGKPTNRVTATPEDLKNINSYPNNEFTYTQPVLYSAVPVHLEFVSGSGYSLGNFTLATPVSAPHVLRMTGHYTVEYKGKAFRMSIDKLLKPSSDISMTGAP